MELKHLVQRFAYKIEPKPEGGFIARVSDPTVPPLEAATREELQQKIQAKVVTALGEAFPSLQIPTPGKQLKFQVHIDRKPEGGFAVHSEETDKTGVTPANHEKLDHAAEQLLGFIDKHFPHLSEQFAAQVGGRDLQVFTTENATATPKKPSSSNWSPIFQPTPSMTSAGQLEATTIENATLNNSLVANLPITPEPARLNPIVRFLLTLLVIAALMYFFMHRG